MCRPFNWTNDLYLDDNVVNSDVNDDTNVLLTEYEGFHVSSIIAVLNTRRYVTYNVYVLYERVYNIIINISRRIVTIIDLWTSLR